MSGLQARQQIKSQLLTLWKLKGERCLSQFCLLYLSRMDMCICLTALVTGRPISSAHPPFEAQLEADEPPFICELALSSATICDCKPNLFFHIFEIWKSERIKVCECDKRAGTSNEATSPNFERKAIMTNTASGNSCTKISTGGGVRWGIIDVDRWGCAMVVLSFVRQSHNSWAWNRIHTAAVTNLTVCAKIRGVCGYAQMICGGADLEKQSQEWQSHNVNYAWFASCKHWIRHREELDMVQVDWNTPPV